MQCGRTAHPWVRDVRGRGLMWGIELADPVTGAWAGELAGRVQARALRGGLIVELGGRDDCVVRLLPPLNVTAEVVDIACDILIEAVEHCVPYGTDDDAGQGDPAEPWAAGTDRTIGSAPLS